MKLSCEIIRDLLPLYCDRACSRDSANAVEEHLQDCKSCQAEFRRMKAEDNIPHTEQNKKEATRVAAFAEFLAETKKREKKKGAALGLSVSLGLILAAFYLLPLLIRDTGSGMFILLIAVPSFCLVSGGVYGFLLGFKWYLPLLAALLFLPAVFLFFNSSALIYVPVFAVLTLIGNLSGWLLGKLYQKCSPKKA